MKKTIKYGFLLLIIIILCCSCTLKKDKLENAVIYTTVYPIDYLTKYLYSDYAQISSIYPKDMKISEYSMTEKQLNTYSKADLFIYNGLSNEIELAKRFVNKNKDILIIDSSYGLTLNNDITELWLSPNNFLMLAKNIRNNLNDYLTSKTIKDSIDEKYHDFEERISTLDANLHTLGKEAKANKKNIIIASNNTFKYLENYNFEVISLSDENNLKENKLNMIKNNFKNSTYKYILLADVDTNNELIQELVNNYKAKVLDVPTMTTNLDDDYFNIMTKYLENVKTCVS